MAHVIGCTLTEMVAAQCVGPDVTKRFLSDNNLDLIVRSHEVHTILWNSVCDECNMPL